MRSEASAREGDPGSAPGAGPTFAGISSWVGPAVVAVAGAFVLAFGWPFGPDSLIDFGRELYVPWRIAAGDLLYGDLLYLNGPLSPHWNALLFSVFGEGLRVVMLANAAIAVVIAALLYALLRRIADELAAFVGTLAFVSFIAFTQLGTMGNYNFLTPYSHEITHGLALSLAALLAFAAIPSGRRRALALSGFCLGLVFLTKVEIFLALAAALGLGVLLARGASPRPFGSALRDLASLAGFAMIPVAVAFLALLWALPLDLATGALLDPWRSVLRSDVTSLEFYRWVRGTDQLGLNLERMGLWLFRYAAFAVPAAALALLIPANPRLRMGVAVAAFGLFVVFFGPGPHFEALLASDAPTRDLRINEWPHATRGLPVALLVIGGAKAAAYLRDRRAGKDLGLASLRLVFILFALGLLAKIFFNVRLHHYGFALALPALLIGTTTLVSWIPRLIDRFGGAGIVFRGAALGLLAVAWVDAFALIEAQYANQRFTLGSGLDRFRTGPKGALVAKALADLEQRLGPDETLAVLPEGVMLNYLSRRGSTVPHTNYMPPEVILYGEDRILADLQAAPPDYVALVHKDTSEYGFPLFGRDYGEKLHAWVLRHYEPVHRVGHVPLKHVRRFGIELRKRSAAPGARAG